MTSRTHPPRRGASRLLAALGLIALFLGASVAGAASAGASSENKTDGFDVVFLDATAGETTSVFRYQLTYDGADDPGADDENRLSHLEVADFCAEIVDVEPGFTSGQKWDSESLATDGQVYEVTFANTDIAVVDGSVATDGTSTWTLKKGSGEGSTKIVTSNGPVCPEEQPSPVTCPDGEMAPENEELVDADGDGEAENCVQVSPEAAEPENRNTPEPNVPEPNVPETPREPELPEPLPEPGLPEPNVPDVDVEGEVITRTPATPEPPAATPAVTATAETPAVVLGSQVQRGQLARTGGDGTVPLTAAGLGLVLLGAALRRFEKRTAPVS